ncbi:G-protein coupled receptor protein [Metarhizium brunneum]
MEQVHPQPASHVLETPIWMMIVRGLQFLVSLIILGLAGALMHDLYLDEFGLSVATAILTWCILFYAVFTEKIPPWRTAYHVLAVTVLDGFLVVMWLATFAAVAARRATFKFNVQVGGCIDDGSIIGSKTCFTRRQLERRDILFKSGGEMMSSIAGLGALLWLMFIATFVWTIVMFLRGRKEGRFPIVGGGGGSNNYQMEPKAEQGASVTQPQQQQQYQSYQQPVQPQQTGQHEQSPLGQNPTPAPYQPAQSPYQQQPPYQPPQDAQQYAQYGQQYPSYQQHVQQGSELSATPLPQQPYSPSPVTSSPPPQQEQQYYHQPQQHPQ